mmetsp:Transcript_5216/g.11535  ORF Transcript_5216/g.11535 Transcript_5216/m.11535 type:complete len:282 (+) Transcript_5216:2344-3189(+)
MNLRTLVVSPTSSSPPGPSAPDTTSPSVAEVSEPTVASLMSYASACEPASRSALGAAISFWFFWGRFLVCVGRDAKPSTLERDFTSASYRELRSSVSMTSLVSLATTREGMEKLMCVVLSCSWMTQNSSTTYLCCCTAGWPLANPPVGPEDCPWAAAPPVSPTLDSSLFRGAVDRACFSSGAFSSMASKPMSALAFLCTSLGPCEGPLRWMRLWGVKIFPLKITCTWEEALLPAVPNPLAVGFPPTVLFDPVTDPFVTGFFTVLPEAPGWKRAFELDIEPG